MKPTLLFALLLPLLACSSTSTEPDRRGPLQPAAPATSCATDISVVPLTHTPTAIAADGTSILFATILGSPRGTVWRLPPGHEPARLLDGYSAGGMQLRGDALVFHELPRVGSPFARLVLHDLATDTTTLLGDEDDRPAGSATFALDRRGRVFYVLDRTDPPAVFLRDPAHSRVHRIETGVRVSKLVAADASIFAFVYRAPGYAVLVHDDALGGFRSLVEYDDPTHYDFVGADAKGIYVSSDRRDEIDVFGHDGTYLRSFGNEVPWDIGPAPIVAGDAIYASRGGVIVRIPTSGAPSTVVYRTDRPVMSLALDACTLNVAIGSPPSIVRVPR